MVGTLYYISYHHKGMRETGTIAKDELTTKHAIADARGIRLHTPQMIGFLLHPHSSPANRRSSVADDHHSQHENSFTHNANLSPLEGVRVT